ncbi:hypothetical protein FRC08_018462 [Ceratobasidium sp. 394]|nr:hypothetical protein FRC08_018462 [Ceratobasidium sp. 394]
MLTKCDFYPFQLASCTFHVLRLDPATLNSHPSCLHSGVLVWDFLLGALSPPDGAAISFLGRYGTEELELRTRPCSAGVSTTTGTGSSYLNHFVATDNVGDTKF